MKYKIMLSSLIVSSLGLTLDPETLVLIVLWIISWRHFYRFW